MDEQLALDKIKAYEDAKYVQDDMEALYLSRRDSILAYVKDDLDALETEMKPYLDLNRKATELAETEAKLAVLSLGGTVKGERFMFVWTKGRTTWDGGKLDGMASIIPQLNDAKKVGEPSVSIRQVK